MVSALEQKVCYWLDLHVKKYSRKERKDFAFSHFNKSPPIVSYGDSEHLIYCIHGDVTLR